MIEIIHSPRRIEIKGHANYAPKGSDIVCAAISSLATSVIASLEGFKESEVEVKKGEITIDIKHKISKDDKTRINLLIKGLKLIAKKYPKHIKIKERLL